MKSTHRKHAVLKLLSVAFVSFQFFPLPVNAVEVLNEPKLKPKADIYVDLSNPVNNKITSIKTGQLKVLIINMIPSEQTNYIVQVESVAYIPAPFEDKALKAQIEAAKKANPKAADATAAMAALNPCPEPTSDYSDILGAKNSIEVAKFVSAAERKIVKITRETDSAQTNCVDHLSKIESAILQTMRAVDVSIDHNEDAKITVSLGSTSDVVASTHIQPRRSEWISSYGFGFVKNEDKNYYSVGDSTAGYVVTKQQDRNDFSYSALAIFTYPIAQLGKGFEFGLSGGIGATENNIAALIGASLVSNKNFIVTAGATFQEFNVLKGQYKVGENVGATLIDSDVLQDKTYKPAFAIVLSYRFGGTGTP